jgi:hypothetical protein
MSYLVVTPECYPPSSSYSQFKDQAPSEDDVIVVPEKYRHILYGYDGTDFAGMALPANRPVDLSGLWTVVVARLLHCSTLTVSLNNMTNIRPTNVTIQLAMAGVTMKPSHVGTKFYYVYDRTGTCLPISTQAYYVKELN